jgi:hypothetical protein
MANDAVYEVNIKLNAQNFEAELNALKTKLERFTKDAKRKNEKDPIFKEGRELTVLKSIQSTQNKLNELKRFGVSTSKQQAKLTEAKAKVEKGQFRSAKNLVSQAQLLNLEKAEDLRIAKLLVAEEKKREREQKKQIDLQKRRGQSIIKSAAIGGGFPLLFGGGLGQAIPGAIGGALGEAASPGGGFAGSIAATALVSQLQQIGQASLETAKKMGTLNGKLELARERSLFTSNETEELARQLERQGKVQQLNNLLSNEYQQIVGSKGVENLRKLNEVSSEFNRLMGILKTKFDAFIAGPLADLLSFLNKSLSADATAGQFREFRNSLKGSQKEFFEEQLKELRGTSGRSSGPITTAIMEEMLKRFQQTPNVISKGKSDKKLTPEAQLGVDRLADLDKEIEKATLKNTLSEKEFETEMRIQEIMKGTTGLTENQIKAKLDKLYVLSKEQEELQKTKELYDSIGNSIEQGIVDAINGAIEGTKTLGDVARSVFTQIQRSLVSYGVNAFLGGLPGGIGKFFSGRANGGPVSKGKTYMVGERGPELFTPGSSGKITPNHDLGGSTNVVVNVDAANTTAQGDNGQAEMLGKMLAGAVQDELLKQQRPGGILYR